MKQHLWFAMMTCLAYCLDKELWKAVDYLKEQVRVLKEQQEKDKRLTRELLETPTVLFTRRPCSRGIASSLPRSTTAAKTARIPDDPRSHRESPTS